MNHYLTRRRRKDIIISRLFFVKRGSFSPPFRYACACKYQHRSLRKSTFRLLSFPLSNSKISSAKFLQSIFRPGYLAKKEWVAILFQSLFSPFSLPFFQSSLSPFFPAAAAEKEEETEEKEELARALLMKKRRRMRIERKKRGGGWRREKGFIIRPSFSVPSAAAMKRRGKNLPPAAAETPETSKDISR